MEVIDWLAGGGLVILIRLSFFLWSRSKADDVWRAKLDTHLLGYDGKGGMVNQLNAVSAELGSLHQGVAKLGGDLSTMESALRLAIQSSRHDLRDEFNKILLSHEAGLQLKIREIEGQARKLETRVHELEVTAQVQRQKSGEAS